MEDGKVGEMSVHEYVFLVVLMKFIIDIQHEQIGDDVDGAANTAGLLDALWTEVGKSFDVRLCQDNEDDSRGRVPLEIETNSLFEVLQGRQGKGKLLEEAGRV